MLACSVTTGICICMHTCLQTCVHKCKKSTLETVYILELQTLPLADKLFEDKGDEITLP